MTATKTIKKTAKTNHHATEITENTMKTTSHSAAQPVSDTTTATTAPPTVGTGGIAPLPAVGAPTVPKGGAPKNGTLVNRSRAPKLFTSLAAGIVKDLRGSTTYVADFGKNAPSQADLADRVALAAGWASEDAAAAAWAAYAHAQATQGWVATQPRLYELAPAFKYAMERDPTIAERYASVQSFFGIAVAAALRGLSTKRAKKKGVTTLKEKEKTAKAAVKADAEAPPAPTAGAVAAPPPTAPAVAVNGSGSAH